MNSIFSPAAGNLIGPHADELRRRGLVIYIPDLAPGGAERVALNLASAFQDMGIPVNLICNSYQAEGRLPLPDGVRVNNLGVDRLFAAVPKLAAELERLRPFAVISFLTATNAVAAMARRRLTQAPRMIVTEHIHPSSACRFRPDWAKRLTLFAMNAFLYRSIDYVVAVSEGVRTDLIRWLRLPGHLVRVIYNPIVSLSLEAASHEPFTSPWPDHAGEPIIVGAGRLEDQKNFPLLIRAFAQLGKRRSARLMILGDGGEREHLESLVSQLGLTDVVHLSGHVNNPYRYYRNASLFVLSSDYEGFGNVIVEALACGTPVVSTNCFSGPSEILDGGRFGVLAPVGDVNALAAAMERALDRTWDAELLKMRAHDFEIDAIARQYIDMILSIA